ncbi:class I SAM-dependent methyltransferase [Pseudonocardia phyllosphaerae]|uniref:class I SAM-dependent methyltransferase n=1 Tax=Pseudonocardia phyllosphaerae TaxID=3390502 RepID=UPI00397AF554
MPETAVRPAWRDLLERWDVQQGVYVEHREQGYEVMLSMLDALVPGDITAVDLAGGPGSIAQRFLARRPGSRCLTVDTDPVLQTIGEGALGDVDGRLRWVRADLRDPEWPSRLAEPSVDAVLSSTALHWLTPDALAAMYRSLSELIRPGGVLVNFDGFPDNGEPTAIDEAVTAVDAARQERAVERGAEPWQDWWDAARAVPELADAFAERDEIFAPARGRFFTAARKKGTSAAFHEAALREAGFSDVQIVWQDLTKKILVAVR